MPRARPHVTVETLTWPLLFRASFLVLRLNVNPLIDSIRSAALGIIS